jgi:hypothetical protein
VKTIGWLAAASMVLLSALPALPEQRRSMISITRAFIIDGRRYLAEKCEGGDMKLIQRQLSRRGIEISLPDSGGDRPSNPCLANALVEDGAASILTSLPVPEGLHAEHKLRMESDSGPLDIVTGPIKTDLPSIRSRMCDRGWIFVDASRSAQPILIATQKKEKETFLVLLDEKERKFLFVRRKE